MACDGDCILIPMACISLIQAKVVMSANSDLESSFLGCVEVAVGLSNLLACRRYSGNQSSSDVSGVMSSVVDSGTPCRLV